MVEVAVEELWPGAAVDLEDDPIANDSGDLDPEELEALSESRRFCYSLVDYIDRETEETVVVYFENDIAGGFPVGYRVPVDLEASPPRPEQADPR